MLTTMHRRTRLRYARNHRNWTARQWRNVLFTDEPLFCLFGNDARIEFGDVDENILKRIMLIQLERSVEDPLWYGVEYQ